MVGIPVSREGFQNKGGHSWEPSPSWAKVGVGWVVQRVPLTVASQSWQEPKKLCTWPGGLAEHEPGLG